MSRMLTLFTATTLGLLICAGLVRPSNVPSVKLTPKNIADQPHALAVGTEKNGDELRFTVLVRMKGGKHKPTVGRGCLLINDGKSFVARTAVPFSNHPEAERNIVLFEFAVSPKYLETSTFSFSVATLDEQALKAANPGTGWRRYELTLQDFPIGGVPEFGVYPELRGK